MSDNKLQEKTAYFEQQELSDKCDDESLLGEAYMRIGIAFAESEPMLSPKLARKSSSFLDPTPKEQMQKFEARGAKQLPSLRPEPLGLKRSATAPDKNITNSFPVIKRRQRPTANTEVKAQDNLKRTTSLPDMRAQNGASFYQRMGVIPRELKNGKNVKLADKIKLEPESRQVLRGKVIYFYPNDDISMPRRQRIHKVIQLGAAWVKSWREDVTHIMVEDNHSYSQVLRHLNKAGLPFDPYVPQCIQFGLLLDPTAGRFLVKGAPSPIQAASSSASTSQSSESQASLQIKPSNRQLSTATYLSQKIDSAPTETNPRDPDPIPSDPIISSDDIVKESFLIDEPTGSTDTIIYHDALSAAIQEAKAIAHLPLDEDEEEEDSLTTISTSFGSDAETDDEILEPPRKRPKFSTAKDKGNPKIPPNAFQCMSPLGTTSSQNPNTRTIEILDQMCKYYDQMQDAWRTVAYRKAITTLRKQTTKITTAKEAATLPFIGLRLADKIEEIVLIDRLRRLDNTRNDPTDQVLRLFLGVYGAGLSQANKWIQAGYRTLHDLVAKARLTDSQKIGVEHYTDFAQRIPRAEVEAHGKHVESALHALDPDFEVTVMGSYRRGAKDSGDIDIIITKPGASISRLRDVVFNTLIPNLMASGFIKCKLATSSRTDDGTKWHGVSCLPSSTTWRRLDLLLVPEYELGAALLYFTGNDIFNRSIRLLASKKGMRLNQRGLYKDVVRGRNRERLNEGTLVEGRDEKRIFEILGVPWREPGERIC
ncbi:hypothetical protein CC80DRAFT_472922 [Byssothecium circinans]|uniref:DNA-directed DNA polymerase n=1 Tax=Byssothecium circinans TaxID=147558 RepID=A0A6A5TUA7_9PLEO|nr:hypothetical protein CC80DRAFT_472922 [Byssothecium circinans]